MMIEILAEAEQDLLDGIRFYERQEAGVGHHFLESLLADIRSLYQFAGVHARDHGYHRMIAKRFPFAIFYRVTGDNILVYAVLDCRRSPVWIQRQLTRRERRSEP
jgi:plasmid stabilization system protein ParE